MFGGSMMRSFDEDPFFDMHRAHMERMNQMMINPFGAMNNDPHMAVTDGREQPRDQHRRGQRTTRNQEVSRRNDPFGGTDMFGDMFGNMNRMMSNMRSMMGNMHSNMPLQGSEMNSPNGNFYSQSSVMTYSNDGKGQPKMYQATTSTRQAGGVKETRKSVKDSEKGIEKMAIGRHIGDRSHVISKECNRRTGSMEENQDLVNLDEDDVGHFDEEWRHKTRSHAGPSRSSRQLGGHRSVDRPRRHTPAIQHRHTEY